MTVWEWISVPNCLCMRCGDLLLIICVWLKHRDHLWSCLSLAWLCSFFVFNDPVVMVVEWISVPNFYWYTAEILNHWRGDSVGRFFLAFGKHWQVIIKQKAPNLWMLLPLVPPKSADGLHLCSDHFPDLVMLIYSFFKLIEFKSVCVNVWLVSIDLPINLLWIWIGILTVTLCDGFGLAVDFLFIVWGVV